VESAGAIIIFLPPYARDLNPIEKGFRSVQSYMQAHYQEAESNPYVVLQNGFASVTQKSGRAHFRAMREAMATM